MARTYPELYILRHGQTVWNAAGRMQGHMDSPLTPLGREQARTLGQILCEQDLPADVSFHCSPLGRTRQTAELALADLTDQPVFDDRLKEVSVGEFEGLTLLDLEQEFPHIVNVESEVSWHYRAPSGESFDEFSTRIRDWLNDLTAPAVVVTHGMVSGVMRGLVLGLDIEGISKLPGGQGIVYHIKDGVHRKLEA